MTSNLSSIQGTLEEELPEGIAKRVSIEPPPDPPSSFSGAKIFDFDEQGKLVDVYFENERPKVYTFKSYIVQ